ncbi:MAG: DUF4249 family protein [Bacteroidales bacterium]|nr:DUF4249 family protein [Bacteroidales bacterium]
MKKWIVILMVLLTGCEEQIPWDLQNKDVMTLIVDGMITNERKAHRVTLTLPVTELNKVPLPVTGALVAITDGDTVYVLKEYPPGSGNYYTDSTVQGVIDKIYYLYIKIDNHEFTSDAARMVPVEPLERFEARQVHENPALYEIIYRESRDPSMLQVYMDWSYLVSPDQKSKAKAWVRYYTLKSIDVNELFKPAAEQVVFPAGTYIYRRKLSLSSSYQSFLRSLMMETEWKGGVFDVLPANVKTNMHSGALGFFAACSVVTDTLVFQP